MKKWVLRVLVMNLVSLAALFFGVRYFENHILFPGSWAREVPEGVDLPKSAEVWRRPLGEGSGQSVEAVFIPATSQPSKGAVVFAHGNAMLIDDWFQVLRTYSNIFGFDVLLVEFRGFGRSGGSPNLENIVDDFRHFFDMMSLRRKDGRPDIIFHGWSVGGGIISELSRLRAPQKVILNSSFYSLQALLSDKLHLPLFLQKLLIPTEMNVLENLKALNIPVQIHHGEIDKLIPPEHGQILKNGLDKSTIFFHEGGHSDSPRDWEKYWLSVANFLGAVPF